MNLNKTETYILWDILEDIKIGQAAVLGDDRAEIPQYDEHYMEVINRLAELLLTCEEVMIDEQPF